jgi:hypothetical protein
MSRRVTLRKGGGEELYLSENADEYADVQLTYSSGHVSFFLDLTLEEARQLNRELGAAIESQAKFKAKV